MKKNIGWIVAGVLAVILVLSVPAMFLLSRVGRFGGMMGNRRMWDGGFERFAHPWMMNSGVRSFIVPFLACLVGIVVLGLVIWGIVALVKALSKPKAIAAPVVVPSPAVVQPEVHHCSNCGKPAQDDWMICPYCGNKLKTE